MTTRAARDVQDTEAFVASSTGFRRALFKVQDSTRQGASIGKGAFANIDFEAGETIIAMQDPVGYQISEWRRMCVKLGRPEMAAIESRSGNCWTDWGPGLPKPRWWYLNDEKENPTLDMVIIKVGAGGNTIAWKAHRDIAAGEELTFNYGCPCSWDFWG